jgi:hypothetical protein
MSCQRYIDNVLYPGRLVITLWERKECRRPPRPCTAPRIYSTSEISLPLHLITHFSNSFTPSSLSLSHPILAALTFPLASYIFRPFISTSSIESFPTPPLRPLFLAFFSSSLYCKQIFSLIKPFPSFCSSIFLLNLIPSQEKSIHPWSGLT